MKKVLLLLVSIVITCTVLLNCTLAFAANFRMYYILEPAAEITSNSARISGTVIQGPIINNDPIWPGYVFILEYWETNNPSTTKKDIGVGAGTDGCIFNELLTGLKPNTEYTYKIISGMPCSPYPDTPSALTFKTLGSSLVGDLNADGKIDSTDCTLMKRYLLRIITVLPTEDELLIGDLNGDNSINSTDYVLLKKYVLRIITEFPKS
ncbi:MAG: dockerin type I domain-containing protein [Bacillota bacterium]